jgi:hypothetical protein
LRVFDYYARAFWVIFMEFRLVKIVVFTPSSRGEVVRNALAKAGAGHIGNYDFCSFSLKGVGRFRALKGAKPFIGKEGELAEVEEERIEVICPVEILEKVIKAVRTVHPYEEPAIDVYPLLNQHDRS